MILRYPQKVSKRTASDPDHTLILKGEWVNYKTPGAVNLYDNL